jgi:hypothetical protein
MTIATRWYVQGTSGTQAIAHVRVARRRNTLRSVVSICVLSFYLGYRWCLEEEDDYNVSIFIFVGSLFQPYYRLN